jgi:glycosyltransferase involved in cell wall biosynthesis
LDLTLVTPHFAPRFEGGTERVARAQARELARRGHRVRVVSGTDDPHRGEDVERAEVDGLPVAFLPRHPEEAYDLALERERLRPLLATEARGADLVHVHHWSTLTGTLVRDLATEHPVVVTLHDLFVTCPRFFRVPATPVATEGCPARGEHEPCARCVAIDAPDVTLDTLETDLRERAAAFQRELAAAALLIVPSEAHATNLRRLVDLPAERTHVVHHGLCLAGGGPAAPPALPYEGADGERLRVLFLGHRTEVKGVRDLVRALAGLEPDERERVELVCLGAEVEAGFDDALRREAAGVALRLEGAYPVEELAARLRAAGGAHLAALPSRVHESYGLVVDEALALGLPVWVSDRGAPRERVGAAGRVLPAEEPAAWRKALREVLRAPDTLEDERRAVAGVRRSAADAAAELEALYRPLADVRGRSSG